MYIKATRERLIPLLSKIIGVVERRHTLPILGNILVSARSSLVQVTGTDLEVEIRTKTNITVEKEGEITLPARKLIEICRALPEGIEISLKIEQERAYLTAGRSKFTLSTLPTRDFPIMDSNEPIECIYVSQQKLRYLLEKTSFAMAQQDVRYYLNGLLLEVKPDRLITVATDGHRLAKVEEKLPTQISNEKQIILPRKTVIELSRLLGAEGDSEIRIDINEKFFRSIIGDTIMTSKLIDGRYPDYEKVIPPEPKNIAYINRENMRQALLRTLILSNEKYRGVRLNLANGILKLQAQNPEQEEAEEELEIIYSNEPIMIGFNIGYLIDVLGVLDEQEVEIGFIDSENSAILRNKNNKNQTYVVMPMRL